MVIAGRRPVILFVSFDLLLGRRVFYAIFGLSNVHRAFDVADFEIQIATQLGSGMTMSTNSTGLLFDRAMTLRTV
jgi:hypothetical protein